jgi:signal transduction histidine kinase
MTAPAPITLAERPPVHRILARVFLMVCVGMIGPLAVLGWAGWSSSGELERHEVDEQATAATFVSLRVQDRLRSGLEALESAALLVQREMGAQDRQRSRDALREVFAHHHGLFTCVAILDERGRTLDTEPEEQAPVDGARLLSEARSFGRATITDLLEEGDGLQRAWAMVPLQSWDGSVIGLLAAAVDPRAGRLSELLKGLPPLRGRALELVDGKGKLIASLAGAKPLSKSDHAQLLGPLVAGHHPQSGTCTSCHPGSFRISPGILAITPLPATHWAVVLQAPQPETFAFSRRLSGNLLALLAALLTFALVFAWGAANSVTRPLAELTRAAERLTAGELSEPIPSLEEDEVGRLGRALDRMRVALKESLERIARTNVELEQRVAERTAALEQKSRDEQAEQERVRELLAKVISAQEDERRRIARELHDETSSSIAALVMRVQAARDAAPEGELKERLEDTRRLAVRTLDEVHRQIRDLRPSVLDDLGLQSAICWYAESHLMKRGIAVRTEFAGFERRLPPQTETVVFRVAQEAMNNIGKHAQAESVLIQASVKECRLELEIEDDGKGFVPEQLAAPGKEGRGWGLLGMRERVEMMGGELELESAPGKGTRLFLWLPLQKTDGQAQEQA